MAADFVHKGFDDLSCFLVECLKHNLLWFSFFYVSFKLLLDFYWLYRSFFWFLLFLLLSFLLFGNFRNKLLEKRVGLVEVSDLIFGQFFSFVLGKGLPLLHVVGVLNLV